MRLLDVDRFPPPVPEDVYETREYAILSHVWTDKEFVFSNLKHPRAELSHIDKVIGAQAQARKDGLNYLWIDTLCIEKASSSELGEAINSMYRWYQEAAVCYVYLSDLDGCPRLSDHEILRPVSSAESRHWGVLFKQSKWFQRGWTLQELIAPRKLQFYDKSWNLIGSLNDLAETVSEITNIHIDMLRHRSSPADFSVAQRMSWAADRRTTRIEDRAYSLLGLLDITISIRYGEGATAFQRLQEAIIARDADQSIFAWERRPVQREDVYLKHEDRQDSLLWLDPEWSQLLAPSPDVFSNARNIVPSNYAQLPYRMTNLGLYITLSVPRGGRQRIILNCHYQDDPTKSILLNIKHDKTVNIRSEESKGVIPVETIAHVDLHKRSAHDQLLSRLSFLDVDEAHRNARPQTFYISRSFRIAKNDEKLHKMWLQLVENDSYLGSTPPSLPLSLLVRPVQIHFESSEPVPDRETSNITWTLPREGDIDYGLHVRLRLAGASDCSLGLHLKLTENRTTVGLTSARHLQPNSKAEQVENWTNGWSFGQETREMYSQLEIEPGLTFRIAIKQHQYNGQDMQVIKACVVRTKVKDSALKCMLKRVFTHEANRRKRSLILAVTKSVTLTVGLFRPQTCSQDLFKHCPTACHSTAWAWSTANNHDLGSAKRSTPAAAESWLHSHRYLVR